LVLLPPPAAQACPERQSVAELQVSVHSIRHEPERVWPDCTTTLGHAPFGNVQLGPQTLLIPQVSGPQSVLVVQGWYVRRQVPM
jgi:hypothetical protein